MPGKFDLGEVKKLILSYRRGESNALWFSARTRSIDSVINVFSCNETAAESIILDGLMTLESADFCRSHLQWESIVDEYGLENYLGFNWYIKFTLDDEEGIKSLEQISFHPLEKEMKLADGRNLKVNF